MPVTKEHWRIWLLHEICWICGSVGLGTLTFVLTNVAAEFGMNQMEKGLAATITYLGMFLGATTSGMLGDRFGRKTMLVISIAMWAVSSFFVAMATTIPVFFIARFLLGFGMAAQFPQTQSMLAELFPPSARGRCICLMEGGYPLACILAGLIGWQLQIYMPWRAVFWVQGAMGLCIFIAIFMIPESARYYEMRGNLDAAKKIVSKLESKVMAITGKDLPEIPDPVVEPLDVTKKSKLAQLFAKGQASKTLTLWVLWFCVLFGHYGLNTWVADLLAGKGFDVVKSNEFVLLMYLPAIPGYLIATWLVEIVGRKKMIFSYLMLAAIFSYLYGAAETTTNIIVFGALLQMFNFGIWSLIYTYASEVFPTRIRATGTGTTSSAGRAGSLLAPTLFGIMMSNSVPEIYIFALASILFLVGGTMTLIFGLETKGRSVEEITVGQ